MNSTKIEKMRIIIKSLFLTVYLLSVIGCMDLLSSNKSKCHKNQILSELEAAKGNGILFGHQDDLAYGVGWRYIEGESDVKRITGDYPALFGWELGGLELEHKSNLDGVPFKKMHDYVVWVHKNGGINTFSWHPHSPIDSVKAWQKDAIVVKHILPKGDYNKQFNYQLEQLAVFLKSLKDEKGHSIPFIFRPWHEMDGSWFWWGSKGCTPEEYKELFRYTIDYLKNKGLNEMVVAYSPDRNFNSGEEYLQWYPGDGYVNILGMDNYYDLKQTGGEKEVIRKLHLIIDIAKAKNKLSALTETGSELVPNSSWYSQKLGIVLNDPIIKENVSYVMVWRNDSETHFFFPFPGHPAADDAKALLNRPYILLLNDFNQLKIK